MKDTLFPIMSILAASAPGEYASLNIEQERKLLNQAIDPLLKKGKVRVTWLEDASFKSIQRILRRENFHIFHFVGHGGFNTNRDEGGLYLDDGTGRGVWFNASRIGVLLNDHRSLRLAVLNACEGARISDRDAFAGVATTLIQRGIPAVVAMQFEISDRAAIVFAEEFYAAITDQMPADAAVAEARKAVYGMPNDIEWGTPVLYMRVPDGMLFRFDEEEEIAAEPPPVKPVPPKEEEAAQNAPAVPDSKARVKLRSQPQELSDEDVKAMLKKYNFFANNFNKSGSFKNDFADNGDGTVTDRATGLMWQKGGSDNYMPHKQAQDYIRDINKKKFAGYSDWRVPTFEELASLLENKKVNGLYIDPVFDERQGWCWSADNRPSGGAWLVHFNRGHVIWSSLHDYNYVRAVRPRQ